MPALPEPEMIAKAASGDQFAFRQLVEQYQGFVFSLSYRFMGNSSDAQDITQEVFIRLWKNLHRYKPGIKLKTWLYKIITNACLDQLRSAQYKRGKTARDIDQYDQVEGVENTGQPLIDIELRDAIVQMADHLTPKQRAVFVLRDLEDLTTGEICEAMSMSPEQVKSNLYYARINLGKLIRKYYSEKKHESI